MPPETDNPAGAPQAESSPLAEALASVGDRWTLLVVAALLDEPLRFNDLLEAVPGITPPNILSQRLRRLEQQGLAVAEPYSRRPPRSLYELTASGRELAGALRQLTDWGARHAHAAEPLRHGVCGSRIEAVWYCPACERPVSDEAPMAALHIVTILCACPAVTSISRMPLTGTGALAASRSRPALRAASTEPPRADRRGIPRPPPPGGD